MKSLARSLFPSLPRVQEARAQNILQYLQISPDVALDVYYFNSITYIFPLFYRTFDHKFEFSESRAGSTRQASSGLLSSSLFVYI